MIIHSNNGQCQKCLETINKFPGFNDTLRLWFFKLQSKHPEAHVSCAGRGYMDQMDKFNQHLSKATYGHSAHNYNCAVDLFVILQGHGIYDEDWFHNVLAPEIPEYLEWYGAPHAKFPELPHVELKDWTLLKAQGLLKLVESMPLEP